MFKVSDATEAAPAARDNRQSAVGQKAGIGISGSTFCPRLSAFVTWSGGMRGARMHLLGRLLVRMPATFAEWRLA
jgi:hypothetical protein